MTCLFPSNVVFLSLLPLLDELDREYAARAERRNLASDIAVIDMRLADDGRRLAEEMGDE
jgi:hypothetical protein